MSITHSEHKIIFFEWMDSEQSVLGGLQDNLVQDNIGNIHYISEKFDIEQARGAEVISIRTHSHISREDIDSMALNGLKVIALRVAGFNMLDVDYAVEKGIKVYRVASYSPESISEYAMSMILGLERKLFVQRELHRDLKENRDIRSMGNLLRTRRLGLHGYGKIARELGRIAREGFKMEVGFFDPFYDGDCSGCTKYDSAEDLYENSDILSVHIPLTKKTEHCIDSDLLSRLPKGATFVNTARGAVVNGEDLVSLFNEGHIGAVGTDVWEISDPFQEELLTPNSFQSYHIAYFTKTSVEQMILQTFENIFGEVRSENILPIETY